MDWLCYTAALLACGITLGNVLVASWTAAKVDRRLAALEAELAAAIGREARRRSADPYVYDMRDVE